MKTTLSPLLAALCLLTLLLSGCGHSPIEPAPAAESMDPLAAEPVAEREPALGTGLIPGLLDARPQEETPGMETYHGVRYTQARPATTASGKALEDHHYFYRVTLEPRRKQVYDEIRSGLLDVDASIPITTEKVTIEEAFDLYQMVVMDGPELFYVSASCSAYYDRNGWTTSIVPDYNQLSQDVSGASEAIRAATASAVEVMEELPSDIERVRFAHDYLTSHVTYVLPSPHDQNCYSALVNHRSVCAGYSRAFQYLLHHVDIPCAYLEGDANGPHAWNLVQLGGQFYAMDVTWDDPMGNHPDRFFYTYFNLTDAEFEYDHTRGPLARMLPRAMGTVYSYSNWYGVPHLPTPVIPEEPVEPEPLPPYEAPLPEYTPDYVPEYVPDYIPEYFPTYDPAWDIPSYEDAPTYDDSIYDPIPLEPLENPRWDEDGNWLGWGDPIVDAPTSWTPTCRSRIPGTIPTGKIPTDRRIRPT